LLSVFWSLLLAAPHFPPSLGPGLETLPAFVVTAGLLLATRPRAAARRWAARGAGRLGAGVSIGYASYPGCVAIIATLGLAIGLPATAAIPSSAPDAAERAIALLLAPAVEEALYRGRLLTALRRALGAVPALALCAALFALPHVHAWSVLGTFLVGLGLGGVRLLGGSLTLCAGIHLGLNLAALVCGLPPRRLAPGPAVGLTSGALLLGTALFSRRPRRPLRSRGNA
jgi:membrane protease YdiL (CAAX protease family)